MIVLDNFTKYDILYRNYIKQFSKAYIVGSNIYVGESLKNCNNIYKCTYIQNFINIYKNIFINLYMTDNKVFNEVNEENLCIICLEELNENIMEVCHKCNVNCHIQCLYDWYRKNNQTEICPICLKTEDYYLNLLNNVTNVNNNSRSNRIQPYTEIDTENRNDVRVLANVSTDSDTDDVTVRNRFLIFENIQPHIRVRYFYSLMLCFMCLIIFIVPLLIP